MKKVLVSLVAIASFAAPALAGKLPCVKNAFGHQGVKAVCLLLNKENDIRGFLLMNANETKSYLVALHSAPVSGAGSPAFIDFTRFRVAPADKNLNLADDTRGTLTVAMDVENYYNFGVKGATPGGRKVDTYGDNELESEVMSDIYNFTSEDASAADVVDGTVFE